LHGDHLVIGGEDVLAPERLDVMRVLVVRVLVVDDLLSHASPLPAA
jgi:hypothetical protein